MGMIFCRGCGKQIHETAVTCPQCGALQMTMPTQAGPRLPDSANSVGAANVSLWNPNATANWSVLFSPAFGSYLQALNWQMLGESEKAKSSKRWFYASLVLFLLLAIFTLLTPEADASGKAGRGIGFIYLLFWYFVVGRSQAKFVKEKFGDSYQRRPWGKPLLIALAAFIGFVAIIAVIEAVLGGAKATISSTNDSRQQAQSPNALPSGASMKLPSSVAAARGTDNDYAPLIDRARSYITEWNREDPLCDEIESPNLDSVQKGTITFIATGGGKVDPPIPAIVARITGTCVVKAFRKREPITKFWMMMAHDKAFNKFTCVKIGGEDLIRGFIKANCEFVPNVGEAGLIQIAPTSTLDVAAVKVDTEAMVQPGVPAANILAPAASPTVTTAKEPAAASPAAREQQPRDPLADTVAEIIAEGNACAAKKNYGCAITNATNALRLSPGNRRATELKVKAEMAQQAAMDNIKLD